MNWFKEIFTKNKVMSSKRVCGVLGFLVSTGILIYCTILTIQAPDMINIFLVTCAGMLGIDSVTDVWKGKKLLPDET